MDSTNQAKTSRLAQWEGAIQAELRDLMSQASALRALQEGAQTNTKRLYYQKKLKKIAPQVHSMLVALDNINHKDEPGSVDAPAT